MTTKPLIGLFIGAFVAFCVAMVIDAHSNRNSIDSAFVSTAVAQENVVDPQPAQEPQQNEPAGPETEAAPAPAPVLEAIRDIVAVGMGRSERLALGSSRPDQPYHFEIEFSSRGGSVASVTMANFGERDDKQEPLKLLSPIEQAGSLSFSTDAMAMIEQRLRIPLGRLDWHMQQLDSDGGRQAVRFTAYIEDQDKVRLMQLSKTYTIYPEQYHIDCEMVLTNLTDQPLSNWFEMHGPVGIETEDVRMDERKVVGGYLNPAGEVVTERLEMKSLGKASSVLLKSREGDRFIWAAVTNKYFATIVRPLPRENIEYADWIDSVSGMLYGKDAISMSLRSSQTRIEPGAEVAFGFQIFMGPKDKKLFDSVPLYQQLGFVNTIDFMACCCPAWIIQPLAFGILALMNTAHMVIPNYGVIIIILVLLVRLILHPVTKKSQVSMMGMSKLGPKAEEIKKRYGDNKQEMNKRLMELYKEAGISPIMGMLPMLLQMPIWIALYSAIYASVDLRGAAFLPFWITDLSAPDALIRWESINLPFGIAIAGLNLLPILLAVAMYLQQKLMPQQMGASANPQMAQQQKIMTVMMPAMMLLFLYSAPSGLNLYIMASTFGGIFEQKVIRKHIKEREERESQGLVPSTAKTGKKKKKKPKPFFKQ